MALVCAAASCEVSVKHGDISVVAFFPFPDDEELCRIWSMRSARYDLLEKTSSEVHATEYLCHLHFEEHSFEKTSIGFALKNDAKPSIFSHDTSNFAAQVEEERSTGLERLFVRPEVATVHYGTSQEGVNIITFHVGVNHKQNESRSVIPASPSGLHQLENGIYLEPGLFIHTKEQEVKSSGFENEEKKDVVTASGESEVAGQGMPLLEESEEKVQSELGSLPELNVDQLQTTVDHDKALSDSAGPQSVDGAATVSAEQLCRVCANHRDDLIPVFGEQGIKIQLLEKILMHLPIQVKADDKMPNKVCYKCVAQLNSWHSVVTTCLIADRRLRRTFNMPDITKHEIQILAEDKRAHKIPDHQIDKTIELIKKDWSANEELAESALTVTDSQDDDPVVVETLENKTNLRQGCIATKKAVVSRRKYKVSKVVDVCVESMDPSQDTKTTFRMELCRDVGKDVSETGVEDGTEIDDCVLWKCKTCGHVADSMSSLFHHEQTDCPSCDRVFDSSASEANHGKELQEVRAQRVVDWASLRAAHSGRGAKFTCDTCNKGFNLKKALREHMRRVHLLESPFTCNVCHKKYGTPISLDIHMATHSSETPYLCDMCGKSFKHISNLRGHKRSHLASAVKNRYVCRLCNAGFRSRFHLFEHLNVHEGRKPYSCQVCGKSFSKKIQLRQHKFAHSDDQPFKCHLCGVGFNRRGNMTQHIKRHYRENKYTCRVCNTKFMTLGAVLIHRKTHSQQELEQNIRNTSDCSNLDEECKCKVCGKLFAKKEFLIIHMRTHTGEKLFECSICGKKLSNRGSLNYHLRSFHTGERPFSCQFCGEGFVSKESRLIHERAHTGEKPYKCEVCDAAFRCRSNLLQHTKVHATTRQFQCQTCGKQFQRKGALNVHMRVHTGERPFTCDLCGKSFSQKNDMLKHRQTHLKDGAKTRVRVARKAAGLEKDAAECGQKQLDGDVALPDQTPVVHLSVENSAPAAADVNPVDLSPVTITPMTIAQPLLITHEALMAECAISMPISENTHSLILQTY